MNAGTELSEVRQHLTVVFSDLCDSTSIASQLEPEEYRELLDTLRRGVEPIVRRYGGEVVRIDGDGFLFVFGYLNANLDATRNAMNAALDLHQEMERLSAHASHTGRKLDIHTGINSGIVLLRAGDIVRGRYELIGDTTNIAARLCDHAAAGEIVVRETALGANRHLFELSEPFSVAVRSRRDGIEACKVIGRRPGQLDTNGDGHDRRGRFIGRGEEIRSLVEFSEHADRGVRLAAVVGEAGMGKSRLLSEFQREAVGRGHRVFWATCDPYLETAPLEPLRIIAGSVLETIEHDATEHEKTLMELPSSLRATVEIVSSGAEALEADDIPRLVEAIVGLLRTLASEQSVVMILDDWHWADNLTQIAIDRLAQDAHGLNLVLVLGGRSDPRSFAELTETRTLRLSPLDDASASEAVLANAPFADPLMIDEIKTLSGKNPLYIEELCHAARRGERGLQIVQTESWLHTLISDRFRSLAPGAASVLQAAAVLGFVVPRGLLCEICGVAADDPVFEKLERADFLFPGKARGTLVFKHGLTQRAIYNLIRYSERKRLHQRVVDNLLQTNDGSRQQDDGQLAYHYAGAGQSVPAVTHAVRAGRAALASSALDKAQRAFRFALGEYYKNGHPQEDIVRIAHLLGLASIVDPSHEQDAEFAAMIDWARANNRPDAVAWAEYWRAFNLYGLGEPKRSLASMIAAQTKAEELNNSQLAMRIHGTIGQIYAANCDYSRAEPGLREAISLQRDRFERSMNPSALSYSLACLGFTLADQGNFEESETLFLEAEQILEGVDHEVLNSVLSYRSVSLIWKGRFVDARRCLERVREISGRMRSRYAHMKSQALLGIVDFLTTGEVALLDEVAQIADSLAAASQQRISIVHGSLAEAYAQCGRTRSARNHAARSLWRARKGDRFGEAQAFRAISILELQMGKPGLSQHALKRAEIAAELRRSSRERALNLYLAEALFGKESGQAAPSPNAVIDPGVFLPLAHLHRRTFKAFASPTTG